ncbi:MAG: DinB family protein [Bacteroidota bacterium]
MTTEHIPVEDMFKLLNEPVSELVDILDSQNVNVLNAIPFKGSWSAAQVTDHITMSTFSIAKALNMESVETDRDPEEKVPGLKKMFLDFTVKYKSPEFILPTHHNYEKDLLVNKLKTAFSQLEERSNAVNLCGMISHPAFGDVTKLELLYFVLYHTKRHLQQVKNIVYIVTKNEIN